MTSLIRWNARPDVLRDRVSRLFDEAFNDFVSPLSGREDTRTGSWMPAVDIRETPESLLFHAELPGMTKDEVELTLEKNTLTLQGERKFERDEQRESYHRIERGYGSFTRTFALPANVRTEDVKATFENGVLTVELPKVEEAKPHRVEIS
ncbi:MAG: Hsp20/alpha crystallin family protein [Thermoanaerobaculia bacterium]